MSLHQRKKFVFKKLHISRNRWRRNAQIEISALRVSWHLPVQPSCSKMMEQKTHSSVDDMYMLFAQNFQSKACKMLPHSTVPYISIQDLHTTYPYLHSKKIGAGTYGKIYQSLNARFAIKVIKDIASFLRELNAYSSFSHPCIMKPVAWSCRLFDSVCDSEIGSNDMFFLVMPLGSDLWRAYRKSRCISLAQIVVDAVSAVAFLNANGIAHCDIKMQNFVFLNGRATLLDFGIASPIIVGHGGVGYLGGHDNYAGWYRDPEHIIGDYNDVRSEVYALGMSIYCLNAHPSSQPPNGSLYNLKLPTPEPDVQPVLDWMLVPVSQRPRMDELETRIRQRWSSRREIIWNDNICEVSLYTESIQAPRLSSWDVFEKNFSKAMFRWLSGVAEKQYLTVHSFFLAIHLFQRVLPVLAPSAMQKLKPGDDADDCSGQIIACACTILANIICIGSNDALYSMWSQYSENAFSAAKLRLKVFEVLRTLDGVLLRRSHWDYAHCAEELPLLLEDSFNLGDYDVRQIRDLLPEAHDYHTTCHRKRLTMPSLTEHFQFDRKNINLDRHVPYHHHPVFVVPETIVSTRLQYCHTHEIAKISLHYIVGTVIAHRAQCATWDCEFARKMFSRLIGEITFTYQVLDLVCKFDWRKRKSFFDHTTNKNPFIVTDQDIDEATLVTAVAHQHI